MSDFGPPPDPFMFSRPFDLGSDDLQQAHQIFLDQDPSFTIPAVDVLSGIVTTLRDIDIEILKLKKNVGVSITAVIRREGKIMDYVRVASLITIGVIDALILSSGARWAQWARSIISIIKTTVATILNSIGFQFLVSTHNLLLTLWEQYRDVFEELSNAASGISAALGYNAEFLPSLLYNVQNIVTASGAILGIPPEESEIKFLKPYADFLSKWDNNFDKYAKNPGAILDDLNQWVTDEALRTASEQAGKIDGALSTVTNTLNEKVIQIDNLVSTVDTFITQLPEEQFSEWQAWWEPRNAAIEKYRDEVIDPGLVYLNEITHEVDRRSRETDLTLAQWQALLASIPSMLTGVYLNTSEAGLFQRGLFEGLVKNATGLFTEEGPDQVAARLANIIPLSELPIDTGGDVVTPILPFIPTSSSRPEPPKMGSILNAIQKEFSGKGINTILNAAQGIL